jgi:hypothetical protein
MRARPFIRQIDSMSFDSSLPKMWVEQVCQCERRGPRIHRSRDP